VCCTIQVQGDHRDPLVGHRDQCWKRAIECLVVERQLFSRQ
jgi:hypothetical protein